MTVTWTEPTATDNSDMAPTITQSHQPGDSFPVGTTQVTYTFADQQGNEALCSFDVIIGNLFAFCIQVKGNYNMHFFSGGFGILY